MHYLASLVAGAEENFMQAEQNDYEQFTITAVENDLYSLANRLNALHEVWRAREVTLETCCDMFSDDIILQWKTVVIDLERITEAVQEVIKLFLIIKSKDRQFNTRRYKPSQPKPPVNTAVKCGQLPPKPR